MNLEPKHPCNTAWQRKWLKLDCWTPRIQHMATEAGNFCGRWFRCESEKTLLVLLGETRCGKTHTARAIFDYCRIAAMKAFETGAWDRGARIPTCCYVRWPEQTDKFKAGDYSRMDEMLDDDLLVIDDIGAEHDPSKNAADKLCQILTRREKRFTVITSNIPVEKHPEQFDVRIADRLLRNSVVVNLFGIEPYGVNA